MVLASDVPLDNRQIEKYCERHLKSLTGFTTQALLRRPSRRNLVLIPLYYDFTLLDNPNYFREFRLLLWYTGQHFNSCFERNIWARHDNGLYCRSDELKLGLKQLSEMHNTTVNGLDKLRSGNDAGWAFIGDACALNRAIVHTYHHRQFSDILAVLLLIQRAALSAPEHGNNVVGDAGGELGTGDVSRQIQIRMVEDLIQWSEQDLPPTDLRRQMFKSLRALVPVDQAGELPAAFDAFCRHLWLSKIRGQTDPVKAQYSYHQASFPRADPGGFYDMFRGKTLDDIQNILAQVDDSLGVLSHETICIWHTAMRYLRAAQKHADVELLCRRLVVRLSLLPSDLGFWQERPEHKQLNVDAALTYYILGRSMEAQGLLLDARLALSRSVRTRAVLVGEGVRDATLGSSLKALMSVAWRLGNVPLTDACARRLARIDAAVKAGQHKMLFGL